MVGRNVVPSPRAPCLRLALLAASPLIACSFNGSGLGPTGGGPGSSESSGSAGQTSGEPGSTAGSSVTEMTPTSVTGVTEETGVTASTGAVEPTTSTTGEVTTITTADPMTTTGSDTTADASSSSGGCAEQSSYYKDSDMDGFGDPDSVMMACDLPDGHVTNQEDCNDGDGLVNPTAQEVCDTQDNDCDDLIDEYNPPMNLECDGCKMALYDGRLYHFCTDEKLWPDALKGCEDRGATLVKDDDQAEHDWLVNQLEDDSGPWYIGALAPDKDDKFVWLDGTPVPKPDGRWASGRPLGGGVTHNLSLVSDGNLLYWLPYNRGWYDRGDIELEPFICEGPLPP